MPVEREDLRESGENEQLPEVRRRMIQALSSIAEMNPEGRVLACTHGGCLWGVISHFDASFGYEDYRRIRTPDMRRVVFGDGPPRLDAAFAFDFPQVESTG